MEIPYTPALILHIVSGFTALLTGTSILIMKKGDALHRKTGRIFFFALILVALSAFILSVIHPNPFLFMVSAFSLYQVLSGYRDVKNRSMRPTAMDILITVLGATNAVAMFASGMMILLVFAGISTFLVIGDIRTFSLKLRDRPVPKMTWLRRHIGHMMGGYIATVTAFLVVNFSSDRWGTIIWLAPTAVGVLLIVFWSRKFIARPPMAPASGK